MKNTKLLLTICTVCIFLFINEVTAKKQLHIETSHPRLMLAKGGEKEIYKKIESNKFLERVHNSIIAQSETFLNQPPLEYKLQGKMLLGVSRAALTRIYFLSYSYRMTGDKRYAKRAKQEILNVCDFSDWCPSHFLDVAEMTTAVSIGYDWLHSELTTEEKKKIKTAITEKGLYESLPEKSSDPEHHKWLRKKNNWNAVCNTGMAIGAIITYEDHPELSRSIIKRSIELVRDVAMQEYMPDGNYPEGYSYWSYGTAYTLMFIDVLEMLYGTSFGMAENSGFLKTPYYILNMSTQNMGCFAYSDCSVNRTLSFPMQWFATRTGNQSLLWAEKERLDIMDAKKLDDNNIFNVRFLPSVMLWGSKESFTNIDPPKKRLYVGQGSTPIAIMRNHWGGNDEIFVGLKGGMCIMNHAHMDIGSFVMYKGSNQWITDLGIQEYNSVEKYGINLGNRSQYAKRWNVLRFSKELHNILIFNGNNQIVDKKANIDYYGDSPEFIYAATDISAVESNSVQKHLRGVAIVQNDYVVVRDEIINNDNLTDTRWAVLTPAKVSVINENSVELSMNGEKLIMTVESPDCEIEMCTWSTAPRYGFDADNFNTTMVGFKTTLQPNQTATFNVFILPETAIKSNEEVLPIKNWNTK